MPNLREKFIEACERELDNGGTGREMRFVGGDVVPILANQVASGCIHGVEETHSLGDLIRRMDDQKLAQYLFALTYRDFELMYCQNKQECMDLVDTGGGVPEENCIACLRHYLQQPATDEERTKIYGA